MAAPMDIKSVLSESNALLDVRAPDKNRLLEELCTRAGKALNLDIEIISRDILKREELGSTGVGDGVAIPHARISGLNRPFGLLARLHKPVDFNSIDGQPVDLVFLLLLPTSAPGDHLNALAAVARRLRDHTTLHRLRSAADHSSMYDVMISG
jgi:PTS system nitrogen regulatory IIA component